MRYVTSILKNLGFSDGSFVKNPGNSQFCPDLVSYQELFSYVSSIRKDKFSNGNIIIERKIRLNLEKTIMILLFIMLWLINFFHYKHSTILYRIAEGFGLTLRLNSMFVYFFMCRSILMGTFESHSSIHGFLGYLIFFGSLGHSIFHILNKFKSNLTYITGFVLLCLIFLLTVSAHNRKYDYKLFQFVHLLSYLFLPLLIVHSHRYWRWYLFPIISVCLECFINFYFKLQISKGKIIMKDNIYLFAPKTIKSVAGAYYRICIPKIGWEWYSFSLANSEFTDQLMFLIEPIGIWTDKLQKLNEFTILICGPFLTSCTKILDNKRNICVSTGIGIAPFLSIMDTKVDLSKINSQFRENYEFTFEEELTQKIAIGPKDIVDFSFNKIGKQKLTCIWICSDFKFVISLYKYIKLILKDCRKIEFKIYITHKFEDHDIEGKFLLLRMLKEEECMYYGRPNFNKMVNYDSMFFCGSPSLKTFLKEKCRNSGIKFYYQIFN